MGPGSAGLILDVQDRPPAAAEGVGRPVPGTRDDQCQGVPGETQPARLTISWITVARFGVRWSGRACPTVDQGAGDQATLAAVRGLEETFRVAVVKVPGLSEVWPWTVSDVEAVLTWSTRNWT